jgi:hypothetical protein
MIMFSRDGRYLDLPSMNTICTACLLLPVSKGMWVAHPEAVRVPSWQMLPRSLL